MATHDYIISNASGAAVRADLNNALAAIATNNSSATAPTTTYAYQWWADTGSSPTVMKLRNAANSAWITLFQLDGEWSNIAFENGSAAAPSIYFKDSGTDTGIYSPGTDQVAITTGGTGRLFVDSSGRVGLGTSSPSGTLEVGAVSGAVTAGDLTVTTGSTTATVTIGRLSSTGNDNTIFNIRNRVGTSTLYMNSGDGRLGIGTNSPSALLDVVGNSNTLSLSSTSTDATTKEAKITCRHYTNSEENAMLVYGASTSTDNAVILGGGSSAQNCATYIQFITAANNTTTSGTERARIDSSGRLLVGTSSSIESTSKLQVKDGSLNIYHASAAASAGYAILFTTDGSSSALAQAKIEGLQESANTSGGRLVFSTSASGSGSPTERMRITNGGNIITGKTDTSFSAAGAVFYGASGTVGAVDFIRSAGNILHINRLTNDGNLVEFYQDGIVEGTISVSGTTVQLNGAHLSRWSQLLGGGREDILRGTVLSNLNEMCEWGDQANEQLNRMKVSDVEGDPNVAGVFVDWDNDDETFTDDFYCAMTGDFIIRIAADVTVQRGDLLMSAGDGTAKPQDDDIIRSKTVAKVTSTHVTCTYEDGSYCVPCVLMAC